MTGEWPSDLCAGVLKQYLRELPEPLMTFDLYSDWIQVAHVYVTLCYQLFYWVSFEWHFIDDSQMSFTSANSFWQWNGLCDAYCCFIYLFIH